MEFQEALFSKSAADARTPSEGGVSVWIWRDVTSVAEGQHSTHKDLYPGYGGLGGSEDWRYEHKLFYYLHCCPVETSMSDPQVKYIETVDLW